MTAIYDQATDARYEIVVSNATDENGWYKAYATKDGDPLPSSVRLSEFRDEAIEQCRAYVDWYRTRDTSTETIPL